MRALRGNSASAVTPWPISWTQVESSVKGVEQVTPVGHEPLQGQDQHRCPEEQPAVTPAATCQTSGSRIARTRRRARVTRREARGGSRAVRRLVGAPARSHRRVDSIEGRDPQVETCGPSGDTRGTQLMRRAAAPTGSEGVPGLFLDFGRLPRKIRKFALNSFYF